MNRVVLTDGSGRWFDTEKAQEFKEATRWDGSNNISRATGSQWEHETLYRTASGLFILNHWSQYQGSKDTYEQISVAEAAKWCSINEHDPETLPREVQEQFAALEL